jgi:hypothetical protein
MKRPPRSLHSLLMQPLPFGTPVGACQYLRTAGRY